MFLNVHYWSRSVWHAVIVIWSPTPTVQLTVIHEGEQLEKCGCVDLSSVKPQDHKQEDQRLKDCRIRSQKQSLASVHGSKKLGHQ